jgi:hypothetical protein
MLKRMVLIAVMIVSLNLGTGLAASAYDLDGLKAGISLIEANKAKIVSLENSLGGLKIDSRANMWNFIGRSSNEKIIQKRSLIVRTVSDLKNENSGLVSELLKSREAMYVGLADGLKDEVFRFVLGYLDSLAMADVLAYGFLDPKDVKLQAKSKERVEFLTYKLDMQDLRQRNIERLMKEFRLSRMAYEGLKLTAEALILDKYIRDLGNKQAEGKKSQEAINNFLK